MTSQPDPREAALAALRSGVSVMPIEHSCKRPPAGFAWKHLQTTRATPEDVTRWFVHDLREAFAGICGAVSGNLLVIDFDRPEYFTQWFSSIGDKLSDGLVVQQTGKGAQAWLRSAQPVPGSEKLAWHPDPESTAGRSVAIETRGEGGYAVMAPSLHPSGRRYELMFGSWSSIPTLPAAHVDALLLAARKLCQTPFTKQEIERAKTAASPRRTNPDARSVIEAYNRDTPIRDALAKHGYTPAYGGRYNRPGGETASVLVGENRSFHFSSNDPLNDGHQQDAFNLLVKLGHNGDVRSAVKAAARELGIERPERPAPVVEVHDRRELPAQPTDRAANLKRVISDRAAGLRENIPWQHHKLSRLTKALIPETTTIVCGSPGSGKSWFVLDEAIQWWVNGERPALKMLEDAHEWHMQRVMALLDRDDSLSPGGSSEGKALEAAHNRHEGALTEIGKLLDDASGDTSHEDLLRWANDRADAGHNILIIDPVTMAEGRSGTVHIDDRAFVRGLGALQRRTGVRVILVTHPRGGKPSENPLDDVAGGKAYSRFTQTVLVLASHKKKPRYASVLDAVGRERAMKVERSILCAKTRNGKGEGASLAFEQDDKTLKFREVGVIIRECKESEVPASVPELGEVADPFP